MNTRYPVVNCHLHGVNRHAGQACEVVTVTTISDAPTPRSSPGKRRSCHKSAIDSATCHDLPLCLLQWLRLRQTPMRLLDLIAQGRTELIRTDEGRVLPGAEAFRDAVLACPVRYVLADDLARCATQLAFAGGDSLTSCLDLVHVPARSLWVEWTEAPRQAVLTTIAALELQGESCARRAGALLTASPDCRAGEIRTFWSTHAELAYLSPVVIGFDLDHVLGTDATADPVFGRGWATVTAPAELVLDDFLQHIRFHFDADWAAYYRNTCKTPEMRSAVLLNNMGTCAFDPPMLFALFLMLSARNALPLRTMAMDRLNLARSRAGKHPLLEHIEVSAPVCAPLSVRVPNSMGTPARRGPRLHHVCGHIARRGSTVFWRAPHLRGSARGGQVRTRTVELCLD
jgi:hypothetical protein